MFSQKCGKAGSKLKCGISRTTAGQLTTMNVGKDVENKLFLYSSGESTKVYYDIRLSCCEYDSVTKQTRMKELRAGFP